MDIHDPSCATPKQTRWASHRGKPSRTEAIGNDLALGHALSKRLCWFRIAADVLGPLLHVKLGCLTWRIMRRLIALIVLALSLALASGPAFAVPAADCAMAGSSSSGMSHDDMDCCKPNCVSTCATLCPGAVVPSVGRAETPDQPIRTQLAALPPAPLHSTDLSGTDPPPRTIIS